MAAVAALVGDRILTAYLNTIYFGNGAYGILQAARTYFDKNAAELTLPEAALLAGLPRSPTFYDPVQHPSAARERRAYVLQLLFDQGRITRGELRKANAAPLPKPDDVHLPGTRGPAAYFVNYVTDQLVGKYGAERVFGGGLEVTTTIDLDLQAKAREAIEKILRDPSGPAAALVAIDPRSGAVKAMFGGTNYRRSQFNLATQAERQPGSSFKPIVLASAFRSGIAPSTEFDSKPVKIDARDRIWPVSNYEGAYLGRVDLWNAMVHSDNSVYAQLTQVVGPRKIVETAHALGIHSKLPAYFAIGLGSVAVNPLDMTRAYATIANDGKRVDGAITGDLPRVVDSVVTRRNGKVRRNSPVAHAVLQPAEAETLMLILEDVVRDGTGTRAQIPGREVAGKTGTTDDYGDAWFVGFTPELAVAVWVGYPDALRPMETEFHGEPVSGGTLPAEIWKAFMTNALDGKAPWRCPLGAIPPRLRPPRRPSRRPVAARQRLLPRYAAHVVLRRAAAEVDGEVLRVRGDRPGRRRPVGRVGGGGAPVCAADARLRLRPREAAFPSRTGREAGSARRLPLGERDGASLRHAGPGRPRAESRRLEPPRRAPAHEEAPARRAGALRPRRALGDLAAAEPRAGGRRAPGAADHTARRRRLDQLAG